MAQPRTFGALFRFAVAFLGLAVLLTGCSDPRNKPEVRTQLTRWQANIDKAIADNVSFTAFKNLYKAELTYPWSHDRKQNGYEVGNSFYFNTVSGREEVGIELSVDDKGKILGGAAEPVWHF